MARTPRMRSLVMLVHQRRCQGLTDAGGAFFRRVVLNPLKAPAAHPLRRFRIIEQRLHRAHQSFNVARLDREAIPAIPQQIGNTSRDLRSHDRQATRHRFVDHQPPWIAVSGEHERLRERIDFRYLFAMHPATKPYHAGLDSRRQPFEFLARCPFPDNDQTYPGADRGIQFGIRVEKFIDPFFPDQPPNTEEIAWRQVVAVTNFSLPLACFFGTGCKKMHVDGIRSNDYGIARCPQCEKVVPRSLPRRHKGLTALAKLSLDELNNTMTTTNIEGSAFRPQ